MYKRPYPIKDNEDVMGLKTNYSYVAQGLINGHIAINSYQDKNEYLQTSKLMYCKDLCHALIVGNHFLCRKNIHK
jgi:hypothetical protein